MAFQSFLSVNYSSLNPSSTLNSHSSPHLIPSPLYFSFHLHITCVLLPSPPLKISLFPHPQSVAIVNINEFEGKIKDPS